MRCAVAVNTAPSMTVTGADLTRDGIPDVFLQLMSFPSHHGAPVSHGALKVDHVAPVQYGAPFSCGAPMMLLTGANLTTDGKPDVWKQLQDEKPCDEYIASALAVSDVAPAVFAALALMLAPALAARKDGEY